MGNPIHIVNERTSAVVASAVELADTRAARNRGLLGRDRLEPGSALVISPCLAVHTAFMRFAIDVVFLDRDGRVLKVVRDLQPWRVALAPRAHAVIELAGGRLESREVSVGDRFYLAPFSAVVGAGTSTSSLIDSLRMTAAKP